MKNKWLWSILRENALSFLLKISYTPSNTDQRRESTMRKIYLQPENMTEELLEDIVKKLGEFTTVGEIAKLFRVSRTTVVRSLERGDICAFLFGRRIVIITRSLQHIIEQEF